MSTIAVLPTPLARAAVAGANPRNLGTCGLYDIAGRLGQAHRRPAWLCRTLDALIAGRGFPAPFPLVRAGVLSDRATADSRWARAAVDAWFDDQLPPAARGLVDQAERAQVDSRLSANLALMFDGAAA